MNVQEAIAYIDNYTWSSTRLGLDRTRELLHAMGDPQKELRFLHVAGSNGKGSTCAMLDSILRCAGYRSGLYISPYLQDFCERIQVNGQNIPGEALAKITEEARLIADAMEDHPSQFELVTAIAMRYFSEQHCDIVVLEVGMGGALDSTNVIDCPEVSVITNIGLEHTEYLGNTLEEIAAAKGGIIKPGGTAVCYDSAPEVIRTLQLICRERGAAFRLAAAGDLTALSHDLHGQRFLWKGEPYETSLLGPHQLRNAGTVLEVLDVLRRRGWEIPEQAVKNGLRTVSWPARFEILRREPLFVLDGGHNPQCAEALAQNLSDYLPGKRILFLMGVLADKDYGQMIDAVAPYADEFYCVTPDSPRALKAGELCAVLKQRGFRAREFEGIKAGVSAALESGKNVVAFGSLYLAGHVRSVFPELCKQMQRRITLAKRDSLSASFRSDASEKICSILLSLPEYRQAGSVMLFKAFRSEVDLSAFAARAQADGKELLYPCCTDKRTMMALHPGRRWIRDAFGIETPDPADAVCAAPQKIDLILCPCAGFDASGRRLGMGAGYYDRFLPQCTRAGTILIAFEAQRLTSVCTDRYDVMMDAAVTEAGFYSFR
ncbi:MAG: 5-formyltetrahydrofolate cyclo-ligase [Oscillospiraceae bacterium]|nr:5-formyltetrahydrofolate cyclo-ligase [Oscillospiraceae bacterium]